MVISSNKIKDTFFNLCYFDANLCPKSYLRTYGQPKTIIRNLKKLLVFINFNLRK